MRKNYIITALTLIIINVNAQILEQDFESATGATDASLGWIQDEPSASTYGWFYDTSPNFVVSGTRSAVAYGGLDNWLISPGFDLNAGDEITIDFNYKTNPNAPAETAAIGIYVGTIKTADIGIQGTVILEDPAINAPNSAAFNTTFTAGVTSTYYIAFHAITGDNASLSIDDIVITSSSLSNDDLKKETVSVYPNPTKDKLMIKNANVKALEMYSVLGQKVLSVVGTQEIDVHNFKRGLYLVKVSLENGTVVTKKVILE